MNASTVIGIFIAGDVLFLLALVATNVYMNKKNGTYKEINMYIATTALFILLLLFSIDTFVSN